MNRNPRQAGAVLVESTVTIIVLFTILFGILEFGRAFKNYQVMTDAAREGARFSVAPDAAAAYAVPSSSAVSTYVSNYLNAGSVRGTTVTVDCVYAPGSPAPNLTFCPAGATATQDNTLPKAPNQNPIYTRVTVSTPYTFIFFPFSITMSTKAVMRNENQGLS